MTVFTGLVTAQLKSGEKTDISFGDNQIIVSLHEYYSCDGATMGNIFTIRNNNISNCYFKITGMPNFRIVYANKTCDIECNDNDNITVELKF